VSIKYPFAVNFTKYNDNYEIPRFSKDGFENENALIWKDLWLLPFSGVSVAGYWHKTFCKDLRNICTCFISTHFGIHNMERNSHSINDWFSLNVWSI